MKRTYIFTYRSGPLFHRHKAVTRRFSNQAEAGRFVDGLRRGGAVDVKYKLEPLT